MVDISVAPTRIKTIRKARKIGRPKLAKLSGLTERRLAKIETSEAVVLDMPTLDRLSEALQVPLPTLTGQFELLEEDLKPVEKCKSGCCG